MISRDSFLRAWRFQNPERIPILAGIPPISWADFDYDVEELESVFLAHPLVLPTYKKGDIHRNHSNVPPDLIKNTPYTDGWGCVWETNCTGLVGSVIKHPLQTWDDFSNYKAPDPEKHNGRYPIDWEQIKKLRETAALKGELFAVGLPHGHTFLRLQDLRGYENLIFDMHDENPNFIKLLEMLTNFNCSYINKCVAVKPDLICIPEDLGTQTSTMLSPEMFKKYIKPVYIAINNIINEPDIVSYMHCDGYVLPIIDDLIECGVSVLNIQDIVNGIDEIAQHVKGRVAIDLDIDRQSVTVQGSVADIDNLICESVSKLAHNSGGLSLVYYPYPPVATRNIEAVFRAMEKHSKWI